jgi:hypothetical protein
MDDDETLQDDYDENKHESMPHQVSVVASVMPSVQHQTVDDEAGEDIEPVPVPTRKPIIKKKVVAAPKK